MNDETRLEPSPPLGHIHFYAKGNKLILTMQNDGKLVRGEGFDSDHAASVAMMDVLAAYVPCFISDLRRRAERAEAELARLKAT